MSEISWGIVQSADPLTVRFAGDTTDAPIGSKQATYQPAEGDKVLLAKMSGTAGDWTAIGPVSLAGSPSWVFVDTGATAESGWSIDTFQAHVSRDLMALKLTVERTGADITVGSSGNITNELLATLPAACLGTSGFNGALGATATGRVTAGYLDPNTGEVRLSAVGGSDNITTGEVLEVGGLVFLGLPE